MLVTTIVDVEDEIVHTEHFKAFLARLGAFLGWPSRDETGGRPSAGLCTA